MQDNWTRFFGPIPYMVALPYENKDNLSIESINLINSFIHLINLYCGPRFRYISRIIPIGPYAKIFPNYSGNVTIEGADHQMNPLCYIYLHTDDTLPSCISFQNIPSDFKYDSTEIETNGHVQC